MSKTRNYEESIEIQATPDEVWKAITEASEIVKWFAPIARVTPGVGGEIFLSWGPGWEGTAPIRIWEPGKRLGWVEGEGTDRPRMNEYLIEAKDESTTVLRVVQSGFDAGAKFEDEIESLSGGWKTFLAMLKYGAENFSGVEAENVWTMRVHQMPQKTAWAKVESAMALTSTTEGAQFQARLGALAFNGTVLRVPKPGYLCLKVDSVGDSLLGVFVEKSGDKAMTTFEWILFGETRKRAGEVRGSIEQFLNETFESESVAEAG